MSSLGPSHPDAAGGSPTAGYVARRFAALGLGEVVARLIAFGATVYAARVLGAAGYGVLGVAAAVTLYLNRIVDGGFDLGLGVREIAADGSFVTRIGPAVFGARTAIAILAVLLTALASRLLPEPEGSVLMVQALGLLAVGLSAKWVHLGQHRTAIVAVATAVGQLVMVILVFLLVREAGDVAGVAQAQVVGDLLAAVIMVVALQRAIGRIAVRLDLDAIRPLIPRAASLVGGAIAGILIYNADFLFLRAFKDAGTVGLYAVAYTLVSFFFNVGAAYNLSLLPALTRLRQDRAGKHRLFVTALSHVFTVSLPVALGGTLLAGPIVSLIFGPKFAGATVALQLLVWCIPLNLVRDVPLMALLSVGREETTLRISSRAAGLNLLLNVALIPSLGMIGAAIATLTTELARLLLAAAAARESDFPSLLAVRVRPALGAGLAMVGTLFAIGRTNVWLDIPLGALAYTTALVLLGGLKFRRGRWPELVA